MATSRCDFRSHQRGGFRAHHRRPGPLHLAGRPAFNRLRFRASRDDTSEHIFAHAGEAVPQTGSKPSLQTPSTVESGGRMLAQRQAVSACWWPVDQFRIRIASRRRIPMVQPGDIVTCPGCNGKGFTQGHGKPSGYGQGVTYSHGARYHCETCNGTGMAEAYMDYFFAVNARNGASSSQGTAYNGLVRSVMVRAGFPVYRTDP